MTAPRQVLGGRALNRALLARQMLLQRKALPVADALEHLIGMQAQVPQAPYIGLWSRLEGFDPGGLSELIAGRRAVRGALMRCTVHLVTSRDWGRLWPAMHSVLARTFRGSPFSKKIDGVELAHVLDFGRDLMSDRALSRAELAPLLAGRWPQADAVSLAQAATLLTPVIQVPPRGLWRQSGQARWMTSTGWLGRDVDEAADHWAIIRRYLAAYGPASIQDIQAWCGLTKLSDVVAELELRRFEDEQGRELLDLPGLALPDPETPAPPRFLPPFDNAILSHAERSRVVSAQDRELLSRDRLMRSFLIDGYVAGSWRIEDGTLHVQPFRRIPAADHRALEDEAAGMIAFLIPDRGRPRATIHPPASA